MAQDHRGREVHSGRRSDEEEDDAIEAFMRNRPVSVWGPPMGDAQAQYGFIDKDVAYKSGAEQFPMSASVRPRDDGRWDARVMRAHSYRSGSRDPMEQATADSRNRINDRLSRPEGFRTERRAKMAVNAMINRRNAGRGHRTGRTYEFGVPY